MILEGKCNTPNTFTRIWPPQKGYKILFQIPFEKFEQQFYFFPTSDNQTVFVATSNEFIFFIPKRSLNRLRVGLKYNNTTRKNEIVVIDPQIIPPKVECVINAGISAVVFVASDVAMVWGCVDLRGSNQHEESLWVFIDAMHPINSSTRLYYLRKYASWALKQLQNISAVTETDMERFVDWDIENYLDGPKTVYKDNSTIQCETASTISYGYFAAVTLLVSYMCLVLGLLVCRLYVNGRVEPSFLY